MFGDCNVNVCHVAQVYGRELALGAVQLDKQALAFVCGTLLHDGLKKTIEDVLSFPEQLAVIVNEIVIICCFGNAHLDFLVAILLVVTTCV